MSSNAKRLPEINLEDFERRLRAAGSAQSPVEDPLEELTRLVNTISAERTQIDERVIDFASARGPKPAAALRPANLDVPEFSQPSEPSESFEEPHAYERETGEAPFLRPSFDESQSSEAPDVIAEERPAGDQPAPAPTRESARAPGRTGSWYAKVGGITVVGLLMLSGAVYLKVSGASVAGSRKPPMILAADGPAKVAPPEEKDVQSPSDTGALINKDSSGSGQVKVVSNQEQPVDLSLKGDSPVAPTKDSPIVAPGAGLPIVQPLATSTADAQAPQPAAPAPNPPAAAPAPQKLGPKSVTVRPDGTLVTADAANFAVAPSPPPTSAPAPATRKIEIAPPVQTQAASPTLDLPAKPGKTTARVNVARTDTTAPTEPVSAPLQLGSAASEKPQKLPTKLRPPETQAEAQPAPAAGGDWAVQLAAPRSEADAQSAIQKLQTKYASALGDNGLAVRKAEVNGDTIYRVRAVGLSKSDAQALCQRLKADGGDCFIARN